MHDREPSAAGSGGASGPIRRLRVRLPGLLLVAGSLTFGASTAPAHDADLAIAAKKLSVRTSGGPDQRRMKFIASDQLPIGLQHFPSQSATWVLVRGYGQNGGTSGRIDLDPNLWTTLGSASSPSGYKYADAAGTRGGITRSSSSPESFRSKAAVPTGPGSRAARRAWSGCTLGSTINRTARALAAIFVTTRPVVSMRRVPFRQGAAGRRSAATPRLS